MMSKTDVIYQSSKKYCFNYFFQSANHIGFAIGIIPCASILLRKRVAFANHTSRHTFAGAISDAIAVRLLSWL
jgi:hypothetical protein